MAERSVAVITDRKWLHRRYAVDQAPVRIIAAEADCDESNVWNALRRFGIPLRGRVDVSHWGDVLTQDYLGACVAEDMSNREIAREVGCHPATVGEWMAAHGFTDLDEDEIRRLRRWYIDEAMSMAEVARRMGCGLRTARRHLLAAGVTLRKPGRRSA